jgi:hypothetical protein
MNGGNEIRMGEGYNNWVTKYLLDGRYYNLLGPRGLELWSDEFPECAEKIRQKLALGALH